MAEAKVVKKVEAPADDVWAQLSDFSGIQPGGPIDAVKYEGEGVGMLRHISMAGGIVSERLDEHDAERRTFTYTIINDDCPLPFANYSATVNISDDGDNTCTVDWTGTFDAKGDEETAVKVATGIYAGGIKGARIALGLD
ncbi:MAG: SRPBCC family protein [Pseudomonadota bacterium]